MAFRVPATGFVLARARSGKQTFTPGRAARRDALKATFALAPNECGGLRKGRGEIWLDATTLLPLRYVERRGRRVHRTTLRYSRLNKKHPAGTFKRPRIGRRGFVESRGFVRTTPANAAAALSYTPLLPTVLPDGFGLRVSGWAPESGFTGDPFDVECGFQFTSKATVDGNDATYGTGPGIEPHLYWSDGELLHTLSGPYPKRDLVAITKSLSPVTS